MKLTLAEHRGKVRESTQESNVLSRGAEMATH